MTSTLTSLTSDWPQEGGRFLDLADWFKLRAKGHMSIFSRESPPLCCVDRSVLPVCVAEQRCCCSKFVFRVFAAVFWGSL